MSYDDFVFNIDELQMCHLSPDAFLAELADNDVSCFFLGVLGRRKAGIFVILLKSC